MVQNFKLLVIRINDIGQTEAHWKPVRGKEQVGTLEQCPNESKALAATDALRLTVNNQSKRSDLRRTSNFHLCHAIPAGATV